MRTYGVAALWLLLVTGCASTRVVRLETGEGAPLEYAPASWSESVRVGSDDFKESLSRLVLALPLSIRPTDSAWLVRASTHGRTMDRVLHGALRRDYGRWCQAHEGPGDCLSLLEDGLGFSARDKLALAVGLSLDPMHESIAEAVEGTFNPNFFKAVVVSALVSWVVLAANPEPVFTKAAAIVSVVLVIYLGVDAFLEVAKASFALKAAADRATTFQELEEAGERFGRVLGREGTHLFVLMGTLLVGQGTAGGAAWLTSRLTLLPRFTEAAALGATQVGVRLEAVGQVSAVAVAVGGLGVSLAPNAVAMAARGSGTEDHHIATIRNEVSTARGGPWTPRFKKLFAKGGMDMKDVENVVPIENHKGPHPEEYHRIIYNALDEATRTCGNMAECRAALTRML